MAKKNAKVKRAEAKKVESKADAELRSRGDAVLAREAAALGFVSAPPVTLPASLPTWKATLDATADATREAAAGQDPAPSAPKAAPAKPAPKANGPDPQAETPP